jgi:hypothetical protein
MLALQLEQHMSTPRRNFRQDMSTHNAIFIEAIRQVSVHCAERGALLHRLMDFYTRSNDTTARLAEESMRASLQEQISSIEARNASLEFELRCTRELGIRPDGTGSAETVNRIFRSLEEQEKPKAVQAINNEGSAHVFRGQNGELIPLEDRVQLLNNMLSTLSDAQRAELLAALSPKSDEDQVRHQRAACAHPAVTSSLYPPAQASALSCHSASRPLAPMILNSCCRARSCLIICRQRFAVGYCARLSTPSSSGTWRCTHLMPSNRRRSRCSS